jgi:hypothetical protein
MNDFVRSLLLVLCGIGALVALVLTYLWYFVFGRSLRRVLMAGLGIMLNRDSRIDLNADVVLEKRPEQVKKEMAQEAAALDFQGEVTAHDQYIPQVAVDGSASFSAQTVDSKAETNTFVSSSFVGGRFRRVAETFVRPFLKMRINPQSDIPAQNVKRKPDSSDVE